MNDGAFQKSSIWLNIGDLVDFAGIQGSLIKVRPKSSASTGHPM